MTISIHNLDIKDLTSIKEKGQEQIFIFHLNINEIKILQIVHEKVQAILYYPIVRIF